MKRVIGIDVWNSFETQMLCSEGLIDFSIPNIYSEAERDKVERK